MQVLQMVRRVVAVAVALTSVAAVAQANESSVVPERDQPTVFRAGRTRFACVMVVPTDFDGDLRWQVELTRRQRCRRAWSAVCVRRRQCPSGGRGH